MNNFLTIINLIIESYLSRINEICYNKLYIITLEKLKNRFDKHNLILLVKRIITINMYIDNCKYCKYYKCLYDNTNLNNIIDVLSICFDRLTVLKNKIDLNKDKIYNTFALSNI